jgi:hypothetical protein
VEVEERVDQDPEISVIQNNLNSLSSPLSRTSPVNQPVETSSSASDESWISSGKLPQQERRQRSSAVRHEEEAVALAMVYHRFFSPPSLKQSNLLT